MRLRKRRRWLVAVAVVLVPVMLIVTVLFLRPHHGPNREFVVPPVPEAPPDLEKLRPAFDAGLEAIRRGDGAEAIRQFSSFTFGKRAVDQYRLYYLANACQLAGDRARARATLAQLWRRHPAFVVQTDAGLNLGTLYAAIADWRHAATVYDDVADRADNSAIAASARWSAIESSFARGDIASVLYDARSIAIRNPRATQAPHAIELVRALTGVAKDAPIKLTDTERLTRAVSLLRDGDPQSALDELTALDTADLRLPIQLNR